MSITASAAENIALGYRLYARRFALPLLLSMKHAACSALSNMLPVWERVLVAGPSANLRTNASAAAAFSFAPRVLEATGWAGCVAVFAGRC